MDRMLAGVSSRKFAGVGEPVGEAVQRSSTATSKTSVSEMFIERTRTALGELMGRRLEDVRVAVMISTVLRSPGARTSSRSESRPRA
jgi:putative transposase